MTASRTFDLALSIMLAVVIIIGVVEMVGCALLPMAVNLLVCVFGWQ